MVHAGDVGFSAAASFDVATLDPDVVARRTLELLDHNSWSREQVLTYQKVRLKKTLQHAVSASAFYRKRIGDLVARNAPLKALPTMNKAILMAEFDRIVTDPRLNRATVEQHIESDSAGLLLLDQYRVVATGGSSDSVACLFMTKPDGNWRLLMRVVSKGCSACRPTRGRWGSVRHRLFILPIVSTPNIGSAGQMPLDCQ
jgi:hypothetical protein